MRNYILALFLFTGLLCTSQRRSNGFYEVNETQKGILLTEFESGAELFVATAPVLVLDDVMDIQTDILEYDTSHSLLFKLNPKGAEKFKNFTENNYPAKLALVLDGKVFSKAKVLMPLSEGIFTLNGFTEKKARAVLNLLLTKLAAQANNQPLFTKSDLVIYEDSAGHKEQELYNAKKDREAFMERESMSGSDCTVYYESYYNPLSLIADIYSFEFGEFSEAACGSPANNVLVKTIDVSTKSKVALTDLFTEASILNALKNDIWVKERALESDLGLETFGSFSEINDWLNSMGYGVFAPDSFAVLDRKEGQVAVRWVAQQYMGFNHNRHFQLGLWLTPNVQYRTIFEKNSHFYLGEFANGLTE